MSTYRYTDHRTGQVFECDATDILAADEIYRASGGTPEYPGVGCEIVLGSSSQEQSGT